MYKRKSTFNSAIEHKFHFQLVFCRILQSPLFNEIFKISNFSIQWNWHTMSIPYVSAALLNNIVILFLVKCLACMTSISSKNEIKSRFTDLLMLAHLSHQASWQYEMPSLLLGFDGVIWADFQPNEKQLSFKLMIMMITNTAMPNLKENGIQSNNEMMEWDILLWTVSQRITVLNTVEE